MKKILLLLAAIAMLSGCTKEYFSDMNRDIRDFVVVNGTWDFRGNVDRPHYYKSFNFPELSNFKYNNGTIVAYLEYQDGNVKVQQTLPFVQSLEDQDGQYIRTIDYDFTDNGNITFYVTHSDFNYGNPPVQPEGMRFRVVILY